MLVKFFTFFHLVDQNVIAGTLLYNLPEPDAFFAMDRLVMHNFPLYWLPSLDGASAGCKACLLCLIEWISDI
jgi:hypothetical protein